MTTLTLAKSPVATVTARHMHDGHGHGIRDTETAIVWNGGSTVYVTVTMQPFLRYWTCPPAAVIRKWVDDMLKGHGMKRDGARIEITGGSLSNWKFHYPVKPVS